MLVSDVEVAGLEFAVTGGDVAGMWSAPDGERAHFHIGTARDLWPRIDALRAELRDQMAIATGQTPHLRAFTAGWGRAFLPPGLAQRMSDVVVVVPHATTHDLPIHLIEVAPQQPFGTLAGITYASSRSLFIRTVERNPARQRNTGQWHFRSDARSIEVPVRSVISGGVDVLADLGAEFAAICRLVVEHFSGERITFLDRGFPYSRAVAKTGIRRKPGPSVLCVMAHGWVDADNHRMSGLLVQRDGGGVSARSIPLHGGRYFDFRDLPLRSAPLEIAAGRDIEVLTAAELEVDGTIGSELVMLLGCSAGWGRVLQGDEPASLAETWLKIGAASVVAPLWDAPIAAVRAWTAEFLDGWAGRDVPKALAWRDAMRRMHAGDFADAPERLGVMTLRGDWL